MSRYRDRPRKARKRRVKKPRRQRTYFQVRHNPSKGLVLKKIISGGQTGGDQGGLGAGKALGLKTGGWVPKGWRTQAGPAPRLEKLGLKEHASGKYPPRTKANVAAADGTLIFGNAASSGCDLTIRTAMIGPSALKGDISKDELGAMRGGIDTSQDWKGAEGDRGELFVVPWRVGQPVPERLEKPFRDWLIKHQIEVLNVAGNREESQRGIAQAVEAFIVSAVRGQPTGGSAEDTWAKRLRLVQEALLKIKQELATATGEERARLRIRWEEKEKEKVRLEKRLKNLKKMHEEGRVRERAGLDPILAMTMGKQTWIYDAVVAGTKTLTTRNSGAAHNLGMKVGDVRRAHMVGVPKKDGEQRERKVWIKMLGTYSTLPKLFKAAGGKEAFLRKEGGIAEGSIPRYDSYSLYEIYLKPPKDWEAPSATAWGEKGSRILPPCSKSLGIDLYVLPITPTAAKRYLMAVTLWMSDRDEVRAVIEKAKTKEAAIEALRFRLSIMVDGAGGLIKTPLFLPRLSHTLDYAEALWTFTVDSEAKPPRFVDKGTDRHEEAFISFGIYSKYLGTVDSVEAINSAFGLDVGLKADLQGIPGAFGSPSLASLLVRWENAQARLKLPNAKAYPTFYRAGTYKEGRGGGLKPVVLLISGPRAGSRPVDVKSGPPKARGEEEGYLLHPGVRGVSPALNMIALTEAMIWGDEQEKGPALEVCFLLPQPIVKGQGSKTREITNAAEYQKWLLVSDYSPLVNLRGLLPYLKFDRNSETRKKVRDLVEAVEVPAEEEEEGEEGGAHFYSEQVSGGALGFFGENTFVQDWPGIYLNFLKEAPRAGHDRTDVTKWLIEENSTLEDYRMTGDMVDVTEAYGAFGPQRKVAEAIVRPVGGITLQAHHIKPSLKAVIEFFEITQGDNQPYYRPARIQVFDGDGILRATLLDVGAELRREYEEDWKAKPQNYTPPVRAEVYLVNRLEAMAAEAEREPSEDKPPPSSTAVGRYLQISGAKVGPGSNNWFMLIPRAAVRQMTMREDVTWGADGLPKKKTVKVEVSPPENWSFYRAGKKWILRIARNALRLSVAGSPTAPTFVLTDPSVPYLFDKMPLYDKETGTTTMVEPVDVGAKKGDPKGYLRVLRQTFGYAPRTAEQRAGIARVLAGQEMGSGVLAGGRQKDPTRVGTSRGWMPTGLYALATKIIDVEKLKSVEVRIDPMQYLRDTMKSVWPLIRNEIGLPLDTPAPRIGASATREEKDLETKALQILLKWTTNQRLADPNDLSWQDKSGDEDEEYDFFFAEDDLIHPRDHALTSEEGEAGLLSPTVSQIISGLDNPRRRARRPRRPRRSRRQRGRGNPRSEDIAFSLREGIEPDPGTDEEYPRPSDNDQLFDAVQEIFPRRARQAALSREERMEEGAKRDFFARFHPGGVDTGQTERMSGLLRGGGPLGEEDRTYLSRFADVSVVEGMDIIDARRKSKRRGRIVTPSGAVCSEHRNTPRLKGYTPALPVLASQSAWILIGPPEKDGDPTRVMSYRNGAHIDCDMLVPPQTPLSVYLGKAIQGMVLWLAEKPRRTDRLVRGLNIGRIGSPSTRSLWERGDRLDVRDMLKKAYSNGTTLRLLTPRQRNEPQERHLTLAQEEADKDEKSYWKAVRGKYSRPSRTTRYPVIEKQEVPKKRKPKKRKRPTKGESS